MQNEYIFYGNRKKQTWATVICLMLAFLLLVGGHFNATHASASLSHGSSSIVYGLFFVLLASILFFSIIWRLPRLTINAKGLKYETVFRTKSAEWDSLGPFVLQTTYVSFRRILSAQGLITGLNTSDNLVSKDALVISNLFADKLQAIITVINQQRAQALAGLPQASADQLLHKKSTASSNSAWQLADTTPWMTYALLGIITLLYGVEMVAEYTQTRQWSPSLFTLIALGGLNKYTVIEQGQFYRILTAPLLHANFSHLLGNGLGLYLGGMMLERLVGHRWFLALFFAGALGGACASLLLNDAQTTTVGASGAIMALFAAMFISSFRLGQNNQKLQIQMQSLRILIPSLLPSLAAAKLHVDLSAHLGGALIGIAGGCLLLKVWKADQPAPPGEMQLGIGLAGSILATVLCFVAVGIHYPAYAEAAGELMPAAQVTAILRMQPGEAASLVGVYPHDMRGHVALATTMLKAKDLSGSESELRTALADNASSILFFGPLPSDRASVMLAALLLQKGNKIEAEEVARAACERPPLDGKDQQWHLQLIKLRMCPSPRAN